MYNKIIELDIWSSFGCFNKSFSNKGGLLTYPIPPKTAIIGMIGSVIGIDFDDYEIIDNKKVYSIEKFYDIQISIQPLFDLKTTRLTYNNSSNNSIANINQEILVNPKYKIFISFPNELNEYELDFVEKIKKHETVYNLYMGRNEFPLNYKFKKYFDRYDQTFTNKNIQDVEIVGILKRSFINELTVDKINLLSINQIGSKPFFEYLINDYPIKRLSFSNFEYEFISFFPDNNSDIESYFSIEELKEGKEILLTKIGDNKWIYLL